MAHFIEVYDDEGRKQVVDEPIDLTMFKKSLYDPTYAYDYHYTNATVKRYFYPNTPKNYEALRAVQPSPDPAFADRNIIYISEGLTGSTHPYPGVHGTTIQNNPANFYYYSWLPQPSVSNQNFGLEVFNELGELSWASYNTSMNILDVLKEPDFRYAGGDLENYWSKNYGHKNVAVIPVSMPFYQENNIVYDVGFSFNAAGALRVYKKVFYRLSDDEIKQGWNDTIGYRLEFLIVDVRNARYIS